MLLFLRLVLGAAFFILAGSAFASIDYNFRSNMHHNGEVIPGYTFVTGLEFPLSYSNSQSRLGVSDGHYFQIEGRSLSFLHFSKGVHDWSSSLFISESFSMTPSIENRWLKAKDLLQFETRYVYNFESWLGVYAHARLQSSFFKSIDLHDKEKTYDLRDVDDKNKELKKASEQALSDPFLPLFVQENLGVFATAIDREMLNWELRSALSFRQTFADNQKVLVEDKDDIIVVRDLHSFFQLGPTAGTSIGGKFWDSNISYSAGIDVMWPAWQSPAKNRTFGDALILEGGASIGLKLNTWASLNYDYSVTRIPDILKKFQQEHAVHLNINFDWVYNFGQPQA